MVEFRHRFSAEEQRHCNPPKQTGEVRSEVYFINTDGRTIVIDSETLI